jgi:hypothetical protein
VDGRGNEPAGRPTPAQAGTLKQQAHTHRELIAVAKRQRPPDDDGLRQIVEFFYRGDRQSLLAREFLRRAICQRLWEREDFALVEFGN